MADDDPAERARDRVLEQHQGLVDAILDAADAVASRWSETADRDAIVDPLAAELDRRGLVDRLPAILVDAVDATGHQFQAAPVAAPPYVVVTSTGPILRATVPAGRLVIAVRVFEVERNPVRYRRRHGGPADVLAVSFVDG